MKEKPLTLDEYVQTKIGDTYTTYDEEHRFKVVENNLGKLVTIAMIGFILFFGTIAHEIVWLGITGVVMMVVTIVPIMISEKKIPVTHKRTVSDMDRMEFIEEYKKYREVQKYK